MRLTFYKTFNNYTGNTIVEYFPSGEWFSDQLTSPLHTPWAMRVDEASGSLSRLDLANHYDHTLCVSHMSSRSRNVDGQMVHVMAWPQSGAYDYYITPAGFRYILGDTRVNRGMAVGRCHSDDREATRAAMRPYLEAFAVAAATISCRSYSEERGTGPATITEHAVETFDALLYLSNTPIGWDWDEQNNILDDGEGADVCCDVCGSWIHEDWPRWGDDMGPEHLCLNCQPSEPLACFACQSFIMDDPNWVFGEPYHSSCMPTVHECPECGDVFEYEDDATSCCEVDGIQSYSYHPTPVFFGEVKKSSIRKFMPGLYLGLELEVECTDSTFGTDRAWTSSEIAEHVKENMDRRAYCKSDGSLNNGVEIVTQPMLLHEHLRSNYDSVLPVLARHGARAWSTTTAGMHIHMSRDAFTEPHLYKMLRFIYGNSESLTRLAGRNSRRWASFDGTNARQVREDARQSGRGERYRAINTQNEATIEARFFRPSLKPTTVYAALELCDAMHLYTKTELSMGQAVKGDVTFDRFVEWCQSGTDYPNLTERIAVRLGANSEMEDN